MQSIADECYAQFTQIVAERRNLDLEKVISLADGRIYTALQAKDLGLVDEIANFEKAVEILKENNMSVLYSTISHKPFLPWLIGCLTEPISKIKNKINYYTWCYYGFQTIIWAEKIK